MKHTLFSKKPSLAKVKTLTLGAIILLVSAYFLGYQLSFVDPLSIVIVLGGTLLVALLSYDYQTLLTSLEEAYYYSSAGTENLERRLQVLTTIAKISRQKGPLALENVSRKMSDPILQKALQLIADGAPKPQVLHIAKLESKLETEQIMDKANMLNALATIAPALGLIGTIIGLVQMLGNITDQELLGHGMSMALLTTLYGAVLSYLILQPLALKLECKSKELDLLGNLTIEGLDAIYDGLNPELIRERGGQRRKAGTLGNMPRPIK